MADRRGLFAYDRWPSRVGEGWHDPGAHPHPDDNLDFHVDLGCGRLPKARIGVDRYPAEGVAIVADLDRGETYGIAPEPGRPAVVDRPDSTRYYTGGLCGESTPDDEHHHLDYPKTQGYPYQLRNIAGPWILPFDDSSIESIISHHFFEHVGDGFVPLMDEIYRVLVPGGVLRAITPLFPSWSAVSDPDHRRYFMADETAGDDGTTTWDTFCGTPDNHWMESFSVPYTHARFKRTHMDYTATPPLEAVFTALDARELRVTLKAVK